MKRPSLRYTPIIVLFVCCLSSAAQAQQAVDSLARHAVESWLVLTDSSKYGESYEQAAQQMKALISKDDWIDVLETTRAPLGMVLSRKLKGVKHSKTLKAAPGHEGVTLEYESSFEKNELVSEYLNAILQKDGTWQVTGYFIR
jgi:hypothetical protein